MALPALSSLLGFAALTQGAFWWAQMSIMAALAGVMGVATLTGRRRCAGDLLVLSAFGALAATLMISAGANGWPAPAQGPAATIVIAFGCYLLAARASEADGSIPILNLLVVVAAAVAALGVVGLALHRLPWATALNGTWRLSSTLTYTNAVAALMAIALPAAIVACPRGRVWRVLCALIAIGLAGTLSRGGILGALAGVIALAAFRGIRPREVVAPLFGAMIGAASLVPAILSMRGGAVFAIAGTAIGIGIASVNATGFVRRALSIGILIAIAGGLLILPFTRIGSTRLVPSSDDRTRLWAQTYHQAAQRPWIGTGPGTYVLAGSRGDAILITRYAHNEYLQTFSEAGVVGLAGVAFAIAACVIAAWRSRPERLSGSHALWAAACSGGVAFLVHSTFDFVWRIPLLVAAAFLLLAVAVRPDSREEPL